MFQIFQEFALPKLTTTPLFSQFERTSHISQEINNVLKDAKNLMVKPSDIEEIIALMKLNGDPIVKKAIAAYQRNEIVILFSDVSKVPINLPYLIVGTGNTYRAYIFADKLMNSLKSSNQYTSLMAVMEAAYLGLSLYKRPNTFASNRPLILSLCNLYSLMATIPLEQKLYMKGDNLTKAMIYAISYFYKMIDGSKISVGTIPYKRIIKDQIDDSVVKQIVDQVKSLPDNSFINMLNAMSSINPVRYKNISSTYMGYFIPTCGAPIMFALENLQYLFLLMTSVTYKTPLTSYALNKTLAVYSKKTLSLINAMNI